MIDRRYESGKSFVMYSKEELEAAQENILQDYGLQLNQYWTLSLTEISQQQAL